MIDWRINSLAGQCLFALGVAALGVQAVVFLKLVDGLQPTLPSFSPKMVIIIINGLALLGGGLALVWARSRKVGGMAIASIFGLSFLALQLPKLFASPIQLTSLVAPAECLVIAATGGLVAYPAARPFSQRFCGVMLLLFGAVHLSQRSFIASLIPEWMPVQQGWPWLTGAAMIVAGLALSADKLARPAAAIIAAMFMSWIPFVHLGRIVANPNDPFEWVFASTAIVLAGCLLLAVGEEGAKDDVARQPLVP